jgi:hypothetical protein
MADLQNELKESANAMKILTEDRGKLREIFVEYQVKFEKVKEQLRRLADQVNE